jgi:hypothetical protein
MLSVQGDRNSVLSIFFKFGVKGLKHINLHYIFEFEHRFNNAFSMDFMTQALIFKKNILIFKENRAKFVFSL